MAGNSIPKVHQLHAVKNSLKDAAFRYCAVLELIRTASALKLREKIHLQLQATDDAVEQGAAAAKSLADAKKLAAHTDSGFVAGLRGVVDLIRVADPKLFARLPSLDNLSVIDPDGYATHLANALRAAGKTGDVLACLVDAAIKRRVEAKATLVKQQAALVDLNKSRASLADVKVLIASADSLIHNSVEPGSPLLKMLKPPKKPAQLGPDGKPLKRTRSKKADAQTAAHGSTSSAASTTPAPSAAHIEETSPSSATSSPSAPQPATPTSNVIDPGQVAVNGVKPNGATGPQVMNGVAHS